MQLLSPSSSNMSFFSEHEIPEPIFYPCQVRHTRVHPVVHSFSYPYLWVVLPVRWRGNSIEKYNSPVVSGWFTVDPGDYLERGNHAGLHGKLRQYLHSQVSRPSAARCLTNRCSTSKMKTIPTSFSLLPPKYLAMSSTPSLSGIYTLPKESWPPLS